MSYVSILAFNIGAKKTERIYSLMQKSNILIILFILVFTVLIIAIANPLARLFVANSDEFITTAAQSLRLAIFGFPFGGPLMLCSGYF